MTATEVPCLICGAELQQAFDGYTPLQPNDGIVCETGGNYGSTVWDSMDGEVLVFMICDPCLVKAGEQGRIVAYRKGRPIVTDSPFWSGHEVVGWERLRDRGTVRWTKDTPPDNEPLFVAREDLPAIPVRSDSDRQLYRNWLTDDGRRRGE